MLPALSPMRDVVAVGQLAVYQANRQEKDVAFSPVDLHLNTDITFGVFDPREPFLSPNGRGRVPQFARQRSKLANDETLDIPLLGHMSVV
jgi:hypothetical protein